MTAKRLPDIPEALAEFDWHDVVTFKHVAAHLASTPEGQGYLLRLVFSRDEMVALECLVLPRWARATSFVVSARDKLRGALEPPTEEHEEPEEDLYRELPEKGNGPPSP